MAVIERSAYNSDYQTAGNECSSTYEGRHVSIYEDLLVHPAHTGGLVKKGDPCVVGNNLVGVSMRTAGSSDDVITLDTEGIWWMDIEAGQANISVGQMVYIDTTTAVVSDDSADVPFGLALGQVINGNTTLIAVKVHAFQVLVGPQP